MFACEKSNCFELQWINIKYSQQREISQKINLNQYSIQVLYDEQKNVL